MAGERHAPVRVGGDLARRADARGHQVRQGLSQRPDVVLRPVGTSGDDPHLEPGRMGQEMAQRDRLRIGVRDLEGREIAVHVRIEVERAPLDKLHDGRADERLGNRADAKQRSRRIDRPLRRQLGISIALGQEDLSVLDDRDRRARYGAALEQPRHGLVDERFERGAVGERRRLRDGCGLRCRLTARLRACDPDREDNGRQRRRQSLQHGRSLLRVGSSVRCRFVGRAGRPDSRLSFRTRGELARSARRTPCTRSPHGRTWRDRSLPAP